MAGNCHKLAVEDWFAVTPAVPADVKRVVFVHGKTFHDGGWFDASASQPQIQVQTVEKSKWETVGVLKDYPATTATSAAGLTGGDFNMVNGTNRNGIARLNANGSLDSSFNPGTGAKTIALQPDGKVLIGGDFTTVNGVVRPRVARLYGDAVAPSLNIARSNAFVIVSWPVTGLNFQLQENTDLALPNSWSPVAQAAVTNAGQISVTVPTTVGRKFFRLKSQ